MENVQSNHQIKTDNLDEDINPKKKTWITPDVITEDVGSVTASSFSGTGSDNGAYS